MVNGPLFARGVWSCFPTLDHREGWRATVNLSTYQWTLDRSSRGGFVALCIRLCRHCCGSLCSKPFFALLIMVSCTVTVCYDVQCTANHCNICGTNSHSVAVTEPSALPINTNTCIDIHSHVSRSLAPDALNNLKFSHGICAVTKRTWEGVELKV